MKNLILILVILSLSNFLVSQNIWEPTNGPNGLVLREVEFIKENSIAISANYSGIYLSDDRGQTWRKIQNGLDHDYSFATSMAVDQNGDLYALIDDKLYILKNGSDEWSLLQSGFLGYRIIVTKEGLIYIILLGFTPLINYSSDHGNTFKSISINVNFRSLDGLYPNGNGNNYLDLLLTNQNAIFKINDDGSGIQQIISGLSREAIICWHPAGHLFIVDDYKGFYRYNTDGKGSIKITSIPETVLHLVVKPNGNLMAFTDYGDYESSDMGVTWKKNQSYIYRKLSKYDLIIYHGNRIFIDHDLYPDCFKANLEFSEDNGVSWMNFEKLFQHPTYHDMFIDKLDRIFTRVCGEQAYSYSTNDGEDWQFLKPPNLSSKALDLCSNQRGELFILLDDDVFFSNDLGNHWMEYPPLDLNSVYKISSNHAGLIIVQGNPLSYITTDGGDNWKIMTDPGVPIRKVIVHPDSSIFVLAAYQLMYTTDLGANWFVIPDSIEYVSDFCISTVGTVYFSGKNISLGKPGLFSTKDKFQTFEFIDAQVYYSNLLIDKDNNLYGLNGSNGEICSVSKDGGRIWETFESGLPYWNYGQHFEMNSKHELFAAMLLDRVYKTVNPMVNTKSIGDHRSDFRISVYPIPAKDIIHIKLHKSKDEQCHWTMLDLTGRCIAIGRASSSGFNINTSYYANGIYLLKFEDSSLPIQKLVIQH